MVTSQKICSRPGIKSLVILSAAKDLSVRISLAFHIDLFRCAKGRV